MSLHVCPGDIFFSSHFYLFIKFLFIFFLFYLFFLLLFFVDSRLANFWDTNCPFGFLLIVFFILVPLL